MYMENSPNCVTRAAKYATCAGEVPIRFRKRVRVVEHASFYGLNSPRSPRPFCLLPGSVCPLPSGPAVAEACVVCGEFAPVPLLVVAGADTASIDLWVGSTPDP